MSELHILGTHHLSKKSKKIITDLVSKGNFDVILSEGIDKTIPFQDWKKEPFLWIDILVWKSILDKWGQDIGTGEILSKKKDIEHIYIDLSEKSLISKFVNWYNHLVYLVLFIGTFSILNKSFNDVWIILVLSCTFFLTQIFYLGYFLFRTNHIRNNYFIEQIRTKLHEKKGNKILVIIGKRHIKPICKELDSNKVNYQLFKG